jgi:hypothetical protein
MNKSAEKFALALFWAIASTALADEVVTNYYAAHPDWREVDGRLYNRAKSIVWTNLVGRLAGRNGQLVIVETVEEHRVYGPPVRERGDALAEIGALSEAAMHASPISPTPRLISREEVAGPMVVVKNPPPEWVKCANGDRLNFKALRVGVTNVNGQTLAIYDFGKPHIVQVVRTNKTNLAKP